MQKLATHHFPVMMWIPNIEEIMIVRSKSLYTHQGFLFEPKQILVPWEIMEYNPEWVSVDIRGRNFILKGNFEHMYWNKGDCEERRRNRLG